MSPMNLKENDSTALLIMSKSVSALEQKYQQKIPVVVFVSCCCLVD